MSEHGRAPSWRQLVGLVAAAILVAAVVGGCSHSGSHSAATGSGPAGTGPTPAGALGAVDWIAPVLQPDGSVTVFADIDETPNYCLVDGVPRLTATAEETDSTVKITVWAYRPAGGSATPRGSSSGACRPITRPAVPVSTAPLHQSLGSRTLTDAKTGHRHPVLIASEVAAPRFVPGGYSQPILSWDESSPDLVTRSYSGPNGQSLLIERRPLPDQPVYDEQVLARGTVLGHVARVVQTGNFADNVCAIWSDPKHVWWVCSQGQPKAALKPASLLRVGNSLR